MATPDVITAARFELNVNELGQAEFSELGGISMEIDVVEFQDNDAQGMIRLHKLPGKAKPATITLKRPMNGTMLLWEWHASINNFSHKAEMPLSKAQRGGTLKMYSMEGGEPVAVYEFLGGWPSK
ncbi:MAG TPA: phage tail protein, partial [Acidimicrobiales bacterium]